MSGGSSASQQTDHRLGPLPLRERLACTDPDVADMFVTASSPFVIIHVSPAWCSLCGWRLEEAIGKNLGLLHGDMTCEHALARMQAALAQSESTTVRLVSYTRAGLPFTNDLTLVPLSLHASHEVTHFVATLRPSPAPQGAKCAERPEPLAFSPHSWLPHTSEGRAMATDGDACDEACRGAAEQMVTRTRSAARLVVSLDDMLEAIMPLLSQHKVVEHVQKGTTI